MAIRITGLNSGLDTDSIIQELVSAYSTKVDDYKKAQTKVEWKQDAWKEMNTKIYGFYSKTLSNMRFATNFTSKKTTTVSDSTKATVIADSTVVNGTQTLKVNKLATAGYLTGTELELDTKITQSSTLSELGISSGTIKLNVGGEEKSVEVTANMKVSELVSALKEQGVTASFDENNQRFFISSSSTGTANDFELVTESKEDMLVLKKLGLLSAQNVIQMTAEDALQEPIRQEAVSSAIADGAITGVTIDEYNAMTDEEKEAVFATLSDSDQEKYTAAAKQTLVREFDANNGVDTSTVDYTDETYIEKRLAALEDAYYDALMENNYDAIKDAYAVKTTASNAEIELNGAVFTNDTNSFSINGLNITATGVTTSEMVISTSTDVDGIYNMIKDFFTEYNTLMNSMEAAYNADSAKGYEPLTDDEKSEMSDEEIEKWETKIKDALLRRDDTLSSVLSSMSSAMSKSYEVNGKKYSLSSFGISTASYFTRVENESYAYHIDGDEDDSTSSGNTDKLKKAIAEDPDAVASFFTQLAKGLYSNLDAKMKSTSLSSSYTVYNDKQLQSEYDDYTDTIEKWQQKLEDLEDYYYEKFAAMETALGELQSQTNSLSSLLGG